MRTSTHRQTKTKLEAAQRIGGAAAAILFAIGSAQAAAQKKSPPSAPPVVTNALPSKPVGSLDPGAVLRALNKLHGKQIRVVGYVQGATHKVDRRGSKPHVLLSSMPCTKLYCRPGVSCNKCYGFAAIVGGGFGLRLVDKKSGKPLRCNGGSCTPPRGRYVISGTLRLHPGIDYADLVVDKITPLPPPKRSTNPGAGASLGRAAIVSWSAPPRSPTGPEPACAMSIASGCGRESPGARWRPISSVELYGRTSPAFARR